MVLPWFEIEKLIWWEAPVMMALGKPDSVSLLFNHFNQYGIHDEEAWGRPRDQKVFPESKGFVDYVLGLEYRYLNLGFRPVQAAGSASGVLQGPVGYNRVYVRLPGPLSVEKWFKSLKDGESFVTNGPMLFTKFTPRGESVDIDIDARSRDPIDRVEVLANGQVIRTIRPSADPHNLRQSVSVEKKNYSWMAVRCWQKDVPTFRLAHSMPFHLGGRWDPSDDARYFVNWIDELIGISKADEKRFRSANERDEVMAIYQKAREVFAAKAANGAATAQSLREMGAIDTHAHIFVNDPAVREILSRLDLRFVNITVVDPYERGFGSWEPQHKYALEVTHGVPGRAPWVSTFDATDWSSRVSPGE